jgi:hypothetical protein
MFDQIQARPIYLTTKFFDRRLPDCLSVDKLQGLFFLKNRIGFCINFFHCEMSFVAACGMRDIELVREHSFFHKILGLEL